MKILIKGGRVIDPAGNKDEVADILTDTTKIVEIAKKIDAKADKVIDAAGKIVMPGLIDMHVHLREPGREDKETVASGTQAALKGGVTTCLVMPNTDPAIDSVENVELLKGIIERGAENNVLISGAITKGRAGKELTDFAALKKAGIAAVSDDGSSVDDLDLMHEAFVLAKKNKLVVICHCEDKTLSAEGVVNLGFISTKLGLRGISKESEYKRIERDILLAQKTACPVHIAHVSCRESIDVIAKAKKKGVVVTAETAPHYFSFDEESVCGYNTNMKMNPPLRSREDLVALRDGLRSGIIDVIASDHAPHTENEKDIEFERAEFGVTGLQTQLSAAITNLVGTHIISWLELARKLSYNPAQILGLTNKGELRAGYDADIIIVAAEKEWAVDKQSLISKSKNNAFMGMKLKGVVECTICSGTITYANY